MIKTQEDFFIKIYTSHFIARVRKDCSGFACERKLETEHKLQYFDPSLLWPSRCVFLVLLMLDLRPRGSLCWVICYILSATSQVPKLHRPGVAFPTTSRLQLAWNSNSTGCRTQLSYIIIRRPLDLWNRMFNCHQAEITVMQFRGHSLPVHHSVVAQWDLHLVPYYQP